ncbi:malonate decarboxylase subunit epsilon [Vogesella sp. LIG4]|uniref:malonate decarboxylase subunit epsilon n=1 Tax=Vogesella sp. LIG4 TaxID=1192162 RepID=UPI00081FA95C|nr:malonate decarboxylase subunit epsilon [Vogesella sp. LIG4]SCK24397.1 malonate decarboxylase epsilon subunit [Vogesella sp. LIG4]
MSVLFVFPGQGAHYPGMLQQLPDHPAIRQTLAEATAALDLPPAQLDSARALHSTVAVQRCLLIAGVASARMLAAEAGPPDMVAGLSIGAYAAAVCAGVLAFADALALVSLRGQLMEQAYPRGYGMSAVIGLDVPQLARVLQQLHAEGQPAWLANINAERQLVVAGADEALHRLAQHAHAAGASCCQRLNMSVPSHCPLLAEPAQQLQQAFAGIALQAPRLAYLSSSAARVLRDPQQIGLDLAGNMARQVRWHDTSRLAVERGARLAVEMLPGNTLSRLLGPVMAPGLALAMQNTRLDTLVALIQREQQRLA